MNKNILELFYADEHTRNTFKEFQVKVLEEMILDDCYKNGGKDSQALSKTKQLIERSYKELEDIFGRVDKPSKEDPR